MPKAVITIPGVRYTTAFTQAGTVEAVLSSGTRLPLKAVNKAEECSYTAISGRVEVSDNAAVTVPEAPAQVGAGINADLLEEWFSPTIDFATSEGSTAAGWVWCEVKEHHFQPGELRRITMRCADNVSGGTADEFRLSVWQYSGTAWRWLASSSNKCRLQDGSDMVFEFADGVQLTGHSLRFCTSTEAADVSKWDETRTVMTRIVPDGCGCHYKRPASKEGVPQMVISLANPKYVLAGTGDGVSEEQNNVLAAFEWDTTYGLSLIHTTDGTVDGRLRLMVGVGTVNLVSGYPVTLQAAQVAISTRTRAVTWTDSTSGTSYNYGGHTMSGTEMQPYGITEPCVWCGEPTLPLLLRGSELRINDTVIDVAKLAQLITQADALLSLAATPAAETVSEASTETI